VLVFDQIWQCNVFFDDALAWKVSRKMRNANTKNVVSSKSRFFPEGISHLHLYLESGKRVFEKCKNKIAVDFLREILRHNVF
jgi:hypothetical protein